MMTGLVIEAVVGTALVIFVFGPLVIGLTWLWVQMWVMIIEWTLDELRRYRGRA